MLSDFVPRVTHLQEESRQKFPILAVSLPPPPFFAALTAALAATTEKNVASKTCNQVALTLCNNSQRFKVEISPGFRRV